ncbi:MAG: TIGR02147 family protein [Myxococcales bacterium]|nr:TIGR02147 family protein [Myxococcales bacterium]
MTDDELYAQDDYRAVIRFWLGEGRSHAEMARRARVSRSMVSMVLAEERDLPLSQARAWGLAMDLAGEELVHFEALVRSEAGESLALRRSARRQVAAARAYRDARRFTETEAHLLSRWYVPVLLELAQVGALTDAASAAEVLWPRVSVDEVQGALDELITRRILTFDDQGTARLDQPLVTERDVGPAVADAVRAYHDAQLEHGRRALREWSHDVRHVGSVVVAVPEDRVGDLIAQIHRLHLDLIPPATTGSEPVRLVQVSVQVFPRTHEPVHPRRT